jgi:hypothetical protein
VSARTLLPLARHVRGLLTASSTEIVHAAPFPQSCVTSSPGCAPPAATTAMAGAVGPITAATGAGDHPPAATRPRGGASC